MTDARTYPHGVPCWVDTQQPDPESASHFYAELLGWSVHDDVPAQAPGPYLIATLEGRDVAAIAPAADQPAAWNTYIAVDDADAAAVAVDRHGGAVVSAPRDAGAGGRAAACTDPDGAAFWLWQARGRPGAQLVNTPGTWNFSDLHSEDPAAALVFYGPVFGWEIEELDIGGDRPGIMYRRPGYGDHLEATVDPDIRTRQANAPAGFADVVAGAAVLEADAPGAHWHVTFSVHDRDAAASTAERLGATVIAVDDAMWNRTATIRDPQGAVLTLSQFTPPDDF